MAIVIEVLNRQLHVVERHKVAADRVRLGRAYDNDVILANKHIDAHHAELRCDEHGQWALHDLQSLNGSSGSKGDLAAEHHIESGQVLYLAGQPIRVFAASHAVPAAQPYNKREQQLVQLGRWPWLLILALGLLLHEVYGLWLDAPDARQPLWSQALVTVPVMVLALAIWPAFLAAWARFHQHEPRFLAHYGLMMLMVNVYLAFDAFLTWLNFNLDGARWVFYLHEVLQVIILTGLLAANFYLALQMSYRRRYALALVLGLLSGVPSLNALWQQKEHLYLRPQFDASLLPLSFYLHQPTDWSTFSQQSEQLFEDVKQLRLESVDEDDSPSP